MSKERELLKRALDRIDWVYPSDIALKDEIRAYLDAEPARKPMTEEEIQKAYVDCSALGSFRHFVSGIRFAEKHHGIGEE